MESDAGRIVGLYERHAAAWVRARERESTLYERPWLERFSALLPSRGAADGSGGFEGHPGLKGSSGIDDAESVGVPSTCSGQALRLAAEAASLRMTAFCSASVLDLGCGAGEPIARYFAERGYAVTGVDSSAAMVTMFRERLPEQEAICADMRTLDLGRRFDGVLAWDSFFHLNHDDQRRMSPIFRMHAAPGAALMFTSGSGHGVAMGELEGEPLFHASLDTDEYRRLLGEAGFEVVAHVVEDDVCCGRTVSLSRPR